MSPSMAELTLIACEIDLYDRRVTAYRLAEREWYWKGITQYLYPCEPAVAGALEEQYQHMYHTTETLEQAALTDTDMC